MLYDDVSLFKKMIIAPEWCAMFKEVIDFAQRFSKKDGHFRQTVNFQGAFEV